MEARKKAYAAVAAAYRKSAAAAEMVAAMYEAAAASGDGPFTPDGRDPSFTRDEALDTAEDADDAPRV